MILNHNITADRVSSPMDKITAIVSLSLKDKASMEVKVMDNLKAMAIRATKVRDMATKALLKAMASLRAMATRAMETQATVTKVLLRAMDNLRVMGSLKATGSPKDMVTKATVPKAHLKEVMTDHQAVAVHKGESNLTAMTPLMILLPNIFRGSRQ